ncbi:Calx-beta domain-containing protein, partial [Microcystis aeruginosa]|uniref:Calx-beta domain-containing protein n=2 Tax=Microcystis aeruginosa TaxID=1126 RepID=UPI001562919B
ISIENFYDFKGTNFDDTIVGSASADYYLSGLAGNDLISGNAGGDWLGGGDGNDTLNGGADNDALYGEAGNDVLIGVNESNLNPGQNETDYLSGGTGSDRFILGNAIKAYYDDQNISSDGGYDYAVITDFNSLEDFIQLHGTVSDYRIILNARGDASNLYFDKPGSEPDELIAILQNVSGLSPENPSFAYVKSNSQLQFSASNFTINENGTVVAPIVITRSGGSQGEVSVTVILSNGTATKPQDYNGSNISVNFADGQISKVVNIPIINDSESETNETITLALSNPNGIALGSQSTATLTIIDDDESIPDFAGNSLGDARNLGILNGSQTLNDYVNAIDNNDYYRFELLKKSTFNLTVGALDADANIQLLNSSGLVVNSAIASLSEIGKINTTLEAGSYYLRVYHKNEATNYTLTAQGTPLQVPLQITHISPDRGSNSGQITITIDGNQFTNNAAVSLIAPDNTIRNATNVLWLDETKLVANFNLESLEVGAYDIKVTDTAGDVQRNDVFTIEEPFKENPLEIDLAVTPRLRPWNIGEVVVTYKNVGNTDILAPLFSLNLLSPSGLAEFIGSNSKYFTSSIVGGVSTGRRGSGGGGGISITLPEDIKFKVAETATFLGTGNQGDSSTLSPGETGTFKIYFSPYPAAMVAAGGGGGGGGAGAGGDAERAVGAIKFSLNIVESGGAGNPINWDAQKDKARPITIPVDAWNVIYKNFTDALGNTSDSFQKALSENASHLGRLGEASDDTSKLLAFELKQANNSLGAGILASNVDSLTPNPGLSLTFARTYLQQISSRFTLGSLGRGWTHNWESQVITEENGNVIIQTGETAILILKTKEDKVLYVNKRTSV